MAIETKERAERRPPKIANQLVTLLRSPMHRLILADKEWMRSGAS